MTVPSAPMGKFGCQMALEVTDNKVQHIAKVLFDAHLETTAGLRYIYLGGGGKVLPNPHFTLQGCQRKMISSMFGCEIYDAITASFAYQDELNKRGDDSTDCVSMVISSAADHGALIFMTLEPVQGILIRDKLYN
jgi:hypothetical protein